MMEFSKFQKNWKSAIAENFFFRIVILMLLAIIAIGSVILQSDPIVVLAPPEIKDKMRIERQSASPEYYREMAVFFSILAGNLSPQNAAFNVEALLKYVHPSVFAEVKNVLMGQVVGVIKNQVTQAYYPDRAEVNGSTVLVSGMLSRKVANSTPVVERLDYQMRINIRDYKAYLEEFTAIYPDRKGVAAESIEDKVRKEFNQFTKPKEESP